jgi:hypothetical protein
VRAELVLELQVVGSALAAAELRERVGQAPVAAEASEHLAALAEAFLVAAFLVAAFLVAAFLVAAFRVAAPAVADIPAEASAFRVAALAVGDSLALAVGDSLAVACRVVASAVADSPAVASACLVEAYRMASAEVASRNRASLVAALEALVAVVEEELCVSFWAFSFLQA